MSSAFQKKLEIPRHFDAFIGHSPAHGEPKQGFRLSQFYPGRI